MSCSHSDGSGGDNLTGLAPTPAGSGPIISWDPFAEPVVRIPLPNNIVTRYDQDQPTRMMVNFPANTSSRLENHVRNKLNTLNGFGTFMPITVPFDDIIDIKTVRYNLEDPVDPKNTVFLINITPGTYHYGKSMPLDLGRGYFPIDVKETLSIFANDTFEDAKDLFFKQQFREKFYQEIEDDDRICFYDYESNTLILRPIIPLDQEATHTVILTKGIKGKDGESIRSPFPYVNHTFQTDDLEKALPFLESLGKDLDDIAFAWTFTTQSVTRFLEAVRDGLDGKGPFGRLKDMFPPVIKEVVDQGVYEPVEDISLFDIGSDMVVEKDPNPYILRTSFIKDIFRSIFPDPMVDIMSTVDTGDIPVSIADLPIEYMVELHNIDYMVMGFFESPSFLVTSDGTISANFVTGEAEVGILKDPYDGESGIPFAAFIPKPTIENKYAQPPYPVVYYQHGLGAASWTALSMANYLAGYGFATVAADAPVIGGPIFDLFPLLWSEGGLSSETIAGQFGVNVDIPLDLMEWLLRDIVFPLLGIDATELELDTYNKIADALFDVGLVRFFLYHGRSYDINDDKYRDTALNFISSNIFVPRDCIIQTVIDIMQFIRVIKGLGDRDDDGKLSLVEGDFNSDGKLDLGGPKNPIFITGQSFGGISSSVFLGVENIVTAGAPQYGGGGLVDILIRSDLITFLDVGLFEIIGPVVVGRPVEDGQEGEVGLTLNAEPNKGSVVKREQSNAVISLFKGQTVRLTNLRTGETKTVEAGEGGNFSLNIAADDGDVLVVTVDEAPLVRGEIEIDYLHDGMGVERNSPRFINLMQLAQMGLEMGDPINYAPHWNLKPLSGAGERHVLFTMGTGDTVVPVSTGIALPRAAGYIDHKMHTALVETGFVEGRTGVEESGFLDGVDPGELSLGETSGFRLYNSNAHGFFCAQEDVGDDGVPNFIEEGYDSVTNPDPAGDNYCPATNPFGTEGNRILDQKEDTSTGEPRSDKDDVLDLDYNQLTQRQIAILFKFGYIKDNLKCDCVLNTDPLDKRETDDWQECRDRGGELACLTSPMCTPIGAPVGYEEEEK